MFTWETALSLAILVALVVAIWRGGAANPVGTRQILDKIGKHDGRLKNVEAKLEETATRGALGVLASQVHALEQHAASSGELLKLKAELDGFRMTVEAKLDGIEALGERTDNKVERVVQLLVEEGLRRK